MIEFFRRYFKKPSTALASANGTTSPTQDHGLTLGGITIPISEWLLSPDLDTQYDAWLLGHQIGVASPYVEKTILAALERLRQSGLDASQLVPRVPTILLNVLKSLRDKNVSAADLAQEISKDVVLVGELLHEVNGAYYSPAQRINSIDSAIHLLGLNGLRMLIARAAFRPIIQHQTGKLAKELAPRVWEHAEKNALACRLLAQQRQLDVFHAFLAGLLNNVGLIVAFRLVDQTGITETLPVSASFQKTFFAHANALSIEIGEQWGFPASVLHAMTEKYDLRNTGSPLTHCLRQADQLAKLRLLTNSGLMSETDSKALLEAHSGLLHCFEQLNQRQE
ncbi:HDOD domain-containing protein [Undibacterium sp. MH2W]|uniref:HDOD domain-containing protein n=1 Tax=Undibacterium sp. MH2W TaxID=3413044 RepID=UPI003BF3750D